MCADIFGGTEPPRWLQDLTRQRPGELGHSVGLALGAGLLAIQPDESGDGMKGWQQGMHEARLNEQDPNWKVKTKALESQVVGNWARAATEWQSFDSKNQDMADWTLNDLPALSQYQQELKTNPDATPPVVQSSQGQKALQQIETSQLRKATLDFKRDQADNMLTIAQLRADNGSAAARIQVANAKKFVDLLATVVNPADQTRIQGMLNKDGSPTPEAWEALTAAPKLDPRVAVVQERGKQARLTEADREKNREILAGVKGDIAEDLSRLNAEQKQAYEELRQDDRKEIENLKGTNRIDIEKMKELSRKDAAGKTISLQQFVDRHWNTAFTLLSKTAPPTESKAMTAARTERLLSGTYYRVDKEAQGGRTGVQEAAPKPVAQPAAPAAPAPAPSTTGTNDVNFDDFQKWKSGK